MPDDQSVPGYRVAIVCIAIAFTLTGLYTGSELGLALGLRAGIRATVLGSIILAVMSIPAAIVGARTRLSTYMIVRNVFGESGSKLVNLVLATVLLGWYAVTAELFGRTCFITVNEYFPGLHAPAFAYTIACSVAVIGTTIFGFRAIERLSLFVAPLLVALTVYVAYRALQHNSWDAIAAMHGTDLVPDLGRGISAVVGGMIANVVLMPDMTRYSRTVFDCALISVTGNGVGAGVALVLAMLPALAFGEQDPMKYMVALHLLGIAFTTLVVSTWSINTVNLYSTGLVMSTALPRARYQRIVVACGVVGTAFAVVGVADRLIDFLVLLGLIVPPIAAVYLADFFLLRRRDYFTAEHIAQGSSTNINGIVACVCGAALGITLYFTKASLTGVPTIESFVSAGCLYLIGERARQSLRRDRRWQLAA
ncbi:MAG TPA: cytosine permease [Steroidobacteraceae bacterium]